jgi:hypothetical protein
VEVAKLRRLRIAREPVQLCMPLPAAGGERSCGDGLWAGLPEETQACLLSLCARLIARTVIVEEEVGRGE